MRNFDGRLRKLEQTTPGLGRCPRCWGRDDVFGVQPPTLCLPTEKCSAVPIQKCSAQVTVYAGAVTLTTTSLFSSRTDFSRSGFLPSAPSVRR